MSEEQTRAMRDWYYKLMEMIETHRNAFQSAHPEIDFYPDITLTWELSPDGKKHVRCEGSPVEVA